MTATDTVNDVETKIAIAPPSMYDVILHNDDKTTVDFVIMILMNIFHKTLDQANELTLRIHENGQGVAGTYSFEVASQKRDETLIISKQNGFPLTCSIRKN